MKHTAATPPSARATSHVAVLLTAAILLVTFVASRYGGLAGEVDTSAFARTIRAVLYDASLTPPRFAYNNGYGYPALAAFLVRLTGLTVMQLQLFGGALLAIWVVLPAWLAYRELTGSARGATLATAIILVQPEFLFPILRGSHEKFTRGLMFFALYLLVRSIMSRQRSRRFAAFLLSFYLVIYALITFNNLLSISFITALGLSLTLSLVATRILTPKPKSTTPTQRRLLYAVGISLILAFFFTFYAYPPARNALYVIQSATDRVAVMLLNVEEVAANPYGVVTTAWTSIYVYFFVTAANWLLLIISFVIWSSQTIRWWRTKSWPEDPRRTLLWSLYGAFGFLGAASIVVDFSGAIAANLQHRVFPSFAMIAAPLVAAWVVERQRSRPASKPITYVLLAAFVGILGLVALTKATNEPLVSNKWTYYTPGELNAVKWSALASPDKQTWTSFDERLPAAISICCAEEVDRQQLDGFQPDPVTRNFLVSDVIRARSQRMNLPLPIEGDSLRIYDNGTSEIYRLRPRTPFQN